MKKLPKSPTHPRRSRACAEERVGATPNSTPPPVISPKWTWHYRALQRLRDRLLSDHVQRTKDAIAPVDAGSTDVVDTTEEQLERDALWRELAAEGDQLFEVDCALQRLRDGLYGICEETGRVIPDDRLRAIPWARYCRSAAEEHEHHVPRRPSLGR